MSNPASLVTISHRLATTSTLLLERSRVLSLHLTPSASSQTQIVRNLTAIRTDLAKISDQLELEASGLVVGGKKRGKGKAKGVEGEMRRQVGETEGRYDRLLEMFGEDEVGREKAKGLRREVKRPPSPVPLPATPKIEEETTPRLPQFSIEPATPGVERPFRDNPDGDGHRPNGFGLGNGDTEGEDRSPHEMLSEQQLMMDDQDERLNLLSNSIGRQNHLSIQIGSELDLHHDLLEDTDQAMDRTTARLSTAKRRLDKVASDAKKYGSTITIVALIFVLLILIIVFKT